MKEKFITSEKFTELTKEFLPDLDEKKFLKQFDKMEHGEVLAKKLNKDTGEEIIYRLKKIFFKEFNMSYSANNKSRKGKELLISSFKLPEGDPLKDF